MSDRWLIVGLGNPGKQYAETRHNIGFMVVEAMGRRHGIAGKQENKFQAIVGTGTAGGQKLVLAEPLTYMNLSGEAVGKLMRYYDVEPERLIVVYDDAALPFGRLRVRGEGSAGGQKGMKSIIQHLGGNQGFPRVRLGIGAPPGQQSLPDYVLSKFSPEERELLPEVIDAAIEAVETLMQNDVDTAMNRVNGLTIGEEPPSSPKPAKKAPAEEPEVTESP